MAIAARAVTSRPIAGCGAISTASARLPSVTAATSNWPASPDARCTRIPKSSTAATCVGRATSASVASNGYPWHKVPSDGPGTGQRVRERHTGKLDIPGSGGPARALKHGLPASFHGDPADRLIVATARERSGTRCGCAPRQTSWTAPSRGSGPMAGRGRLADLPRGVLRRARVAAIMAGARRVRAREPADPHARPRRRTHFRGDRRMPVSEDLATPKLPPVDPLPLTGLRVLDLTLARAGPTCVRHLADWGADIIRVEPPGSNEGFGGARDGFDFVNLHRNKRCIALDLKDPDAHAAFLALVKTADVLVENMRVQVKHRLKIAYDDLRPVNPRLVYASISGFGQTGPYSKRGGVDQIAQGMGGLMSITGRAGPRADARGHPDRRSHRGQPARVRRHARAVRAEDDGRGPLRAHEPARGAGLHAGLPGQPLPDGRRGRGAGRQRPSRSTSRWACSPRPTSPSTSRPRRPSSGRCSAAPRRSRNGSRCRSGRRRRGAARTARASTPPSPR